MTFAQLDDNDSAPRSALFQLEAGPRVHGRETLAFAQRLHRALVQLSDGAPVFTGCDAQRRPLPGHQHCFIFPEVGHTEAIRQLRLYARSGFDDAARAVLKQLQVLSWFRGEVLELKLLGFENAVETGIFGCSRFWRSLTPFVPTRFPKSTRRGVPKRDESGLQKGTAEHDLLRLLREEGLVPTLTERMDAAWLAGRAYPWHHFDIERRGGDGRRGPRMACGFRLRFDEPVRGPIALGYGAHFGLGQFVPEQELPR
jgi:CRISPR-associated protein Csb2